MPVPLPSRKAVEFAREIAPRAWRPPHEKRIIHAEAITESFGISPDGSRLAVAGWEQLFSIVIGGGLAGLAPARRR